MHLANRRVELADDLAHFLQSRRRVLTRTGCCVRGSTNRDAALARGSSPGRRSSPSARRRRRTAAACWSRSGFCEVLRLHVVQLERLGDQRLELADLHAALSSCCFSLSASSSRGAIRTTLPFLRMSRPLVCMMMSSAWSHGMSFRRSVRLPGHRVAGDDVEAGEVGDHLQHRAHFDVLEVERKLLALVARRACPGSACSDLPGSA